MHFAIMLGQTNVIFEIFVCVKNLPAVNLLSKWKTNTKLALGYRIGRGVGGWQWRIKNNNTGGI